MPSRGYLIPALVLWFAANGWLVKTKILPAFTAGSPPAYADVLPTQAVTLAPVRWAIRWNERDIGWAENRISRKRDGTGSVVSEVQFEQLPVADLVGDVLGVVGRWTGSLMTRDLGSIDLRVLSTLSFDNYGALHRFDAVVDVGSMPELLQIEGELRDEVLELVARVQSRPEELQEIYRDQVRLPPGALVADTFSPRPELADLRVGQTWTFQSYRPLMPYDPLALIEATVEAEELVGWNGQLVKTKVVSYRGDAGSGLSSTRTPISRAWVAKNGTVLRQEIVLTSIRVQFIRLPDEPESGMIRSNR